MGENRLSSLTLLHVHRNTSIDLEDAVDRYARLHTRKLQFILRGLVVPIILALHNLPKCTY